MRRISALLACLTLASALPGHADPGTDGMQIVFCHDRERDLIQRVRLRRCGGRVVSADEATRIAARIEAEREARRRRAVGQHARQERTDLEFSGAGAAFAVNRLGELVTSAHVVRGCDALEARRGADRVALPARVKARDEAQDLAVLRIGRASPDYIRFAGQSAADGEPLALIGYPSEGLIRRTPRLTPVLASRAISDPVRAGLLGVAGEVRRGNSGGPALDSRGRAVGVLKAKVNSVAARKLTGRTLTDLGVVVDGERVKRFLAATGTPFDLAGEDSSEKSGRALFAMGSSATYRIDCLVKRAP